MILASMLLLFIVFIILLLTAITCIIEGVTEKNNPYINTKDTEINNDEYIDDKSEEVDRESIEISNIDNIDNTIKIVYKRKNNDYKNNDRIKYTDYLKKVKEN